MILNYAINDTLNIQFNEYLQDNVSTSAGEFSAYQLSNLALLKRNAYHHFNFKLSILNIFDKEYYYPSTNLAQGYPGAGRSIQLQLSYNLK
jgi:outer membrane receptor for Fe3+-dicitrate